LGEILPQQAARDGTIKCKFDCVRNLALLAALANTAEKPDFAMVLSQPFIHTIKARHTFFILHIIHIKQNTKRKNIIIMANIQMNAMFLFRHLDVL